MLILPEKKIQIVVPQSGEKFEYQPDKKQYGRISKTGSESIG